MNDIGTPLMVGSKELIVAPQAPDSLLEVLMLA